MATVSVNNLRKTYGDVISVENVNLDIAQGEMITLLGPSGCGKTTTLRIIAGLIQEDGGTVEIDGFSMKKVPPWKRDIGFVFQNYALFPHLTIYNNIAYGLNIRKWNKTKVKEQVHKVSQLAEISELLERRPAQLSGGQQQRVAMARALATNPKVLLMDEPLSGLDAKLRERVQYELKELQRGSNITTIYVTHDQQEAFALADRVVVMNKGKIEQIDSAQRIHDHPKTNFVATFIGSSNRLKGKIVEIGQGDGKTIIQCEETLFIAKYKDGYKVNEEVDVVIRTKKIKLQKEKGNSNSLPTEIIRSTFSGNYWKVIVKNKNIELKVDLEDYRFSDYMQPGSMIQANIDMDDVWYFHS